jgi:hypothetical protein
MAAMAQRIRGARRRKSIQVSPPSAIQRLSSCPPPTHAIEWQRLAINVRPNARSVALLS